MTAPVAARQTRKSPFHKSSSSIVCSSAGRGLLLREIFRPEEVAMLQERNVRVAALTHAPQDSALELR